MKTFGNIKSIKTAICVLICCLFVTACTDEYLDIKPNKKQSTPDTLDDLEALLDNPTKMNFFGASIGEISADNYYLSFDDWNAISEVTARNAYIWDDDLFNDRENNDWSYLYMTVFYSNVVLEGLEKIKPDAHSVKRRNNIKGCALMFRAYSFYQLSQLFMKPYSKSIEQTEPGIALRLSSDLNEKSVRSSMKETFERIIADASEAALLLDVIPKYKTRPSKPAALGLLARTFLDQGNYIKSGKFADSCLSLYNTPLLDYNSLVANAASPVPQYNSEVIFHTRMFSRSIMSAARCKVDSNLYRSYHVNDLRRKIFFKTSGNSSSFKGSYDGSSSLYNGIAADEMYLVRAESRARTGNKEDALKDLNELISKRYLKGKFIPFTASTEEETLTEILKERRKELIFRGSRWGDMRRLNQESRFAVKVERLLNGKKYDLVPNSNKYVLPLPGSVIAASGMAQNPR